MQQQYVIYVRRSSDESASRQVRSIPDQIETCVQYAEREWLTIKERPDDFSDFETYQNRLTELQDIDTHNQFIYESTRDLFVIKEYKSAKTPGNRPKWFQLIERVRDGRITGIISYAPDRSARNLQEAGELVELADSGMVELRYTNAEFPDNASGRMMLGINFVLAKQFSDHLSEVITDRSRQAVLSGKALSQYKHWYFRNEEGYYEPHPMYFPLIKEAFKKKLYSYATDREILEWLDTQGYQREYPYSDRVTTYSHSKNMGNVWRDPFYYGVYESGDISVDYRDGNLNPYYQPLISEEEHQMLVARICERGKSSTKKKPYLQELFPVEYGFIRTEDKSVLTPTLPNKHRFIKKLSKLRETYPQATLKDIVMPHQIYLRCGNKHSPYYRLSLPYSDILAEILDAIRTISSPTLLESYELYSHWHNTIYKQDIHQQKENKKSLKLRLGAVKKRRDTYIQTSLTRTLTPKEEELHNYSLITYAKQIETLEDELANLQHEETWELLSESEYADVVTNLSEIFSLATYQEKSILTSLLFSDITINKNKTITLHNS